MENEKEFVHIITNEYFPTPGEKMAFCGKEINGYHGYAYADQVDLYDQNNLCVDCLQADDYALYLLGNVGEDSATFSGISGTSTGRFSSAHPNMVDIKRDLVKAMDDIQYEAEGATFEVIVSPSEYEAMKKAVEKEVGK